MYSYNVIIQDFFLRIMLTEIYLYFDLCPTFPAYTYDERHLPGSLPVLHLFTLLVSFQPGMGGGWGGAGGGGGFVSFFSHILTHFHPECAHDLTT